MIEDDVVRRVTRLAQLGQHHPLLALELVGVEARPADEVGDQLDAQRQVAAKQPGVEHGMVARRPGVQRSPDILDVLGDALGVATAGALEHHMLDQMGEPALAGSLGPRADVGIKADGKRLDAGHGLDRHGQPVGQAVKPCAHPRGRARAPICASTAASVAGSRV